MYKQRQRYSRWSPFWQQITKHKQSRVTLVKAEALASIIAKPNETN